MFDDITKAIVIIFAMFSLLLIVIKASEELDQSKHQYPALAVVIEVDENHAYCETATGFIYIIPAEDYQVGDTVTFIMHDNNTTNTIEDDYVLVDRFGGYVYEKESDKNEN